MLALLLALQLTAAAPDLTVLVFTTTDCPISNRYAPEIKRLSETFSGKARFVLVYPAASDSDEKSPPVAIKSRTTRPVTSCASRNGSPRPTR